MNMDKDPMIPSNWTKSRQAAFYRCDNTAEGVVGVNGVGHCTFTKSPDGTPDFGTPAAWGEQLELPSGETI